MGKIDFKSLNQDLLSRCPGLLSQWIPQGKVIGDEYCVGDITGKAGKSLRISLESGAWIDHASTQDKGGDLISLYAALNRLSQGDAVKILNPKPVKSNLIKPPAGIDVPNMHHSTLGNPSGVWSYLDTEGELLFYIARYDLKDGKEFCPWSWDGHAWVKRAWPTPRPIYGLEYLKDKRDASILIVEGEKSCESLRAIISESYIIMTWPGGANSVKNADWKSIYGRNILIWPDADKAGITAGQWLGDHLSGKCKSVKIIDVSDLSDGWDAADAIDDGMTWSDIVEWARPRAKIYITPIPSQTTQVTNILNVTEEVLDAPINSAIIQAWLALGVKPNRQGTVAPSADNVLKALDGLPDFKNFAWWDEFHMRHYTTWKAGNCKTTATREWTDNDDLELMIYFQDKMGLSRVTVQTTNQAFQVYCGRRKRNEPRDYLESLKWDGQERIGRFLEISFGAPKTDFVLHVSINFWVSMVARIFKPGCKVDNMLVLEGSQGIYKSEALKVIASNWFAEAFQDLHNKDFFLSLQGKLITEIGELDAFSRADVTTIKRMLSCQIDRYRPPYGRYPSDYPRQGIFVGSTNKDDWNRDDTGARRFWPVTVTNVDLDYIKDVKDQCFAEAVNAYKNGCTWWKVPKEEAEIEQEKRRQTDPWEPIIEEYLLGKDTVLVNQILTECLHIEPGKLDKWMQMRAANCLKLAGFKKEDSWLNGNKAKYWGRNSGKVGRGGN